MLSFEETGKILDAACEELPEGLFRELNGGVSLQRGDRRNPDGRYILGLYHNDVMGRWIEIFYGSFQAVHGSLPDGEFAEELKKVLYHELTHHVEGLAGDRTLEKQDEQETEEYREGVSLARFDCGPDRPEQSSHMRRRARPARPFEEEGDR